MTKAFVPRLVAPIWRVLAATGLLLAAAMVPALADDPAYELHAILPLTGGAAFLGQSVQGAMKIAEQEINRQGGIAGRNVRFVFHDDQTSPQVAVQLITEIKSSQPAVVFGSTLSAMCNAMAPLVRAGPVLYCLSPGIHPEAGSFVFTASVSSKDYLEALLRYFRLKGWTRIAVLTTIDSSGQDADHAIAELMAAPEQASVTLVAHTHLSPGDVSAAAQIETIRAASPQAVIIWVTGGGIATIFRDITQSGLDLPIAASTSTMTYAQMEQYRSFLPKQLYFATAEWLAAGDANLSGSAPVAAQQKDYFALMGAAGLRPDAAAETGWDPPILVASVLNQLGAGATAEQLRAALVQRKPAAGIDGIYDFPAIPQRGLGIANTVVAKWYPTSNQWQVVSQPGGMPLGMSQ